MLFIHKNILGEHNQNQLSTTKILFPPNMHRETVFDFFLLHEVNGTLIQDELGR